MTSHNIWKHLHIKLSDLVQKVEIFQISEIFRNFRNFSKFSKKFKMFQIFKILQFFEVFQSYLTFSEVLQNKISFEFIEFFDSPHMKFFEVFLTLKIFEIL